MSKTHKLALSVGILVAVAAVLAWLGGSQEKSHALRIALNLPLSGPIAAFMAPFPEGLRMGLEEGAEATGLPADFYSLDIQDNAGKPAQALSIAQKQLLAGFDAYISGSTEMTVAIIEEIDAVKKPHFLIAFDAFLTGKGPDRLRILPSYKLEGPLWVEYARQRNAKRIFMLTLNNAPIEEEFSVIVEPGLRELGAEFRRERFEWTGSDYRTLAQRVKEFNPDLIMVNGYSVHLYPAISALRAAGLVGDNNVLASLDFVDLLYGDTPEAELANIAFISPLFEIPGAVPENDAWRERFEERFGKRPSYVAAYAYDTGRMLAKAASLHAQPTKADLLATLPMEGASGAVQVDQEGDLSSTLTIATMESSGTIQSLHQKIYDEYKTSN